MKNFKIHLKAQREGDLNRLLVPRDTDGYQCGQDSEVLNKKYLVFFDLSKCADPLVPINGCLTPQTCVESCPSSNFVHDKTVCEKDFAAYKERLICTRHVDMKSIKNCDDVHTRIVNDQCAKWYLKSEPCKLNCIVKIEFPSIPPSNFSSRFWFNDWQFLYFCENIFTVK